MRGLGRTTGAITIVNALPTGIGAAAGIDLTSEAELELTPTRHGATGRVRIAAASDSPLTRATLLAALRRFAPGQDHHATLTIRSRIPPARGLKSSSAVSCAILLAAADAVEATPSALDVAALSASVCQEIGLSATGAFDDALAGLVGGIVVTDNRKRRLLRHDPVDPSWKTVLYIPRRSHAPSVRYLSAFVSAEGEGRGAVEAALHGDPLQAIGRNTELVERILGYTYRPLRETLRSHGALGSGVSGMGPTLAAIAPSDRAPRVLAALPVAHADKLEATFARGVLRAPPVTP